MDCVLRDLQIGFDRTPGNYILRVGGVLSQASFYFGYFMSLKWLDSRLKSNAVPKVFSQFNAPGSA